METAEGRLVISASNAGLSWTPCAQVLPEASSHPLPRPADAQLEIDEELLPEDGFDEPEEVKLGARHAHDELAREPRVGERSTRHCRRRCLRY